MVIQNENSNTICFSLFLVSCGNDSTIQASYLDGYNSLSVGEAFNNWGLCDSTSWQSFETENGRSIVEYQCTQFDEISETRENLRTIVSNLDPDIDLQAIGCAEYLFNLEEHCTFEVQDYLDTLANPITFAIQFTVNQNDTFEISYIGFETSESSFSANLNEVNEFLEIIYGDNVWSEDYVDQIVTSLSRTVVPR